jgi:predicted alpha/beta hydrolase
MKIADIETRKGDKIVATIFESQLNDHVIIIAGAMGTKQKFYSRFAEFTSTQGITVITFDYTGIGQSLTKPISTIQSNVWDWGKSDLELVIAFARGKYPTAKISLIGHSIGGQLIGLAPSSVQAHKIILVAAQSGYWKFWPGIFKYFLWANWNALFPFLTKIFNYMTSKYFSGMEHLPYNVARQWSKWCTSSNYLFDELESEHLYFHKIKATIYSYSVEDDNYAPKKAVDWLSEKFKNSNVVRVHLQRSQLKKNHIGHFGFFKDMFKDDLWKDFIKNVKE